MLNPHPKRNKIELTDYNYEQDIENRLILSELSLFEVEVLEEILHSSIKIPVNQLAKSLDVDEKKLNPVLKKLSKMKLLKQQKDMILVDKEMRKYYESQMIKFDDNFKADIGFLQGFLNMLPIHVLPIWYAIPRTSDNIFQSIIEKYFFTPKIYRRYLNDLYFEDDILDKIAKDILSAKDFKISTKELIDKYSISREKLEEYMLLLEFNFVGFLSYRRADDAWEEVITPLHEWKQFLKYLNTTTPKSIVETDIIQRQHPHDFGFVQDMTRLLNGAQDHPLPLEPLNDGFTLSKKIAKNILSHLESYQLTQDYIKTLIDKLLLLRLATNQNDTFHPTKLAKEWVEKSVQGQAVDLYRYKKKQSQQLSRDIREIEKCLKRFSNLGWIYFEDFLNGSIAPIGSAQPVTIQRKGRRWKYEVPQYSDEEQKIVKRIVLERLFESGIVAPGTHEGKPCFCVTPFGRMSIE